MQEASFVENHLLRWESRGLPHVNRPFVPNKSNPISRHSNDPAPQTQDPDPNRSATRALANQDWVAMSPGWH